MKETMILIGEQIGEILIGAAIGQMAVNAMSDCRTGTKVLVAVGASLAAWTVGRIFGKELCKLSDEYLDTNFMVD